MFIYFVECGSGGPIKIGLASDPDDRLEEMQVGSPYELAILAVQPGSRVIEKAIHEKFAEGRLRGEWFRPDTPGLSEHIRRAVHCEVMFAEYARAICSACRIWPVLPPRTRVCSDGCDQVANNAAKARHRERRRSAA